MSKTKTYILFILAELHIETKNTFNSNLIFFFLISAFDGKSKRFVYYYVLIYMLYYSNYIPFNIIWDNRINILFDYTNLNLKIFTSSFHDLYFFPYRSVYKIDLCIPAQSSLLGEIIIYDTFYYVYDIDNIESIYKEISSSLNSYLLDYRLHSINLTELNFLDEPFVHPYDNSINECFYIEISRSLLFSFLYRIYSKTILSIKTKIH